MILSALRRRGMLVVAATVATAVLIALGWWRASVLRESAIQFWIAPIAGTASVMETAVERWLLERERDAEVVAKVAGGYSPLFAESTSASAAAEEARSHLVNSLGAIEAAGDFGGIWVLDASGREVASAPGSGPPPSIVEQLLPSMLPATTTLIHGPSRGTNGRLDLLFLAPVAWDAEGDAGQPPDRAPGVVVLRSDPATYLFPLVSAPPITTASGQTILVARVGDDVTVLAPLRLPPTEPLALRVSWAEAPEAARQALAGSRDWLIGDDFRGMRVLAVPRQIEPTGWGLIRQLDEADINRSYRQQLWLEVLLVLAAMTVLTSLVLIVRRALRIERLQRQLVRLELDHLKSQLQPHFLFNTLNAIAELVHRDPEKADRLIVRLGDLLRISLDIGGKQEVTLRDELNLLDAYVEIELTRCGDRLSVSMEIEPGALDAMVPVLILQPLVENAIRHGMSDLSKPGHIHIRARSGHKTLELRVEDNGVGLGNSPHQKGSGVGVSNTRLRLRQLYGDRHEFELVNRPGGGVSAIIVIPLHSEAMVRTAEWSTVGSG
jgi:hypothetical protein